MKKKVFGLVLLVVLFLSSCASSKKQKLLSVYVTDSKKVRLLAPSALEHEVNVMQMFTGSFVASKKEAVNMIACTECTAEKISVVMMNELGIEIASLLYSSSDISLQSSFLPSNVKPEYIIMDFQNVYYKPSLLATEYKASGLSFMVEKNGGVERRFIKDGDVIIEMIEKKDKEILLHNYLRGYTYRLTELDDE